MGMSEIQWSEGSAEAAIGDRAVIGEQIVARLRTGAANIFLTVFLELRGQFGSWRGGGRGRKCGAQGSRAHSPVLPKALLAEKGRGNTITLATDFANTRSDLAELSP